MGGNNLSDEEKKFILKNYWKFEKVEKVLKKWKETYNTPPPSRHTIYRVRDKFEETGSIKNAPKSGRPRTATTAENEEQAAMVFLANPQKSTKMASKELGISRSSLERIRKKLPANRQRPIPPKKLCPDKPCPDKPCPDKPKKLPEANQCFDQERTLAENQPCANNQPMISQQMINHQMFAPQLFSPQMFSQHMLSQQEINHQFFKQQIMHQISSKCTDVEDMQGERHAVDPNPNTEVK